MRRRNKKRIKFFIFMIFLVILFAFALNYYIVTMRPLLEKYASAELANRINLMINRTTAEQLKKNNITYDALIEISNDSEGRIASLTTKVDKMNDLKLDVEQALLDNFIEIEHITVDVPIGSLIGGEFLSGRGPSIKIRAVPVTRVYTEYDNKFDSAGINQTRHRVLLNYTVSLNILLPGKREGVEIKNEICIGETIIVGLIPDFYAEK